MALLIGSRAVIEFKSEVTPLTHMTGFQRLVIGMSAVLVAARMFFPVDLCVQRAFSCVNVPVTLLHAGGMLVLAAAVIALFPSPSWRRLVGPAVFVATVSLLALRIIFPVQTRVLAFEYTSGPVLLPYPLSWADRALMTLGIYQIDVNTLPPPGMSVSAWRLLAQGGLLPDWTATSLHVLAILLAGTAIIVFTRRGREGRKL